LEKYASANGFAVVLDVSNPQTSPVPLGQHREQSSPKELVDAYDKANPAGAPAPAAKPAGATRPANTARSSGCDACSSSNFADTEETVIVPENHMGACAGGLLFFCRSGNFPSLFGVKSLSMEVRKNVRDTLLESSSAPRKGKSAGPWQLRSRRKPIIGGLLVVVPLLSTE